MKPALKTKDKTLLRLPLIELIFQANKIRRQFVGNKIELCNIINAKSGLCSEDCKFCAQSARHSTDISTFALRSQEEMVRAARYARKIGAKKFGIVTSGNCLNPKEVARVARAIRQIKEKIDIQVCASLGALTRRNLRLLKQAGLSRYHHNIETAPRFYPRVVTTHSLKQRLHTIRAAKEAGLEVCSGGIIGLGESWRDRIEMAHILRDLEVDSVPINMLVPIRGTPLQSQEPISCSDAIRTISIFRIILQDKTIKIAAGREGILKDLQGLGFVAGANGILIGGYLTIPGRGLRADQRLIQEIKALWTE